MPGRARVIAAVFKRDFTSFFRNPTGYVFITLFVFASAVAAFWQAGFFLNNLANLDQLNRYFPYLIVFLAPAITMGLWAEERKLGTEELLLTLPAGDGSIVAGKYLAALAIYTVALVFSLSNVVVLNLLGSPDQGMLASTYLGYWLIGAALLALGLLASELTDNLTVAYILGAVLCAVPVSLRFAGSILTGDAQRLAEQLSVVEQFRGLSQGVVSLSALVYFLSIAVGVLYLAVKVAGRSRWPTRANSPRLALHLVARALALIAIIGSATVLAGRAGGRLDVTSEQIHSLAPATVALINQIRPEKPVFIRAYIGPEAPRSYLDVRRDLLSLLREYREVGRGRIFTRVIETVLYSPQAREARERYGIEPVDVPPSEESEGVSKFYLGLVFDCGADEFVIPRFDRGLPVEYELTRSVRVVSRARRRKVGILDTKANLFGGFDFQTKRQRRDWSIVPELRKQYEVVRVAADKAYPEGLDALIAVLPNTLSRAGLARLTAYVSSGKPVLIALDPLPAFNLSLAPEAAAGPPPMGGSAPPAKTDLGPLLKTLGVEWRPDRIIWDRYNPHPQFRELPPEVLFIAPGSGAKMSFQEGDAATAGLQEVVMLYAGALAPAPGHEKSFTPLMTTGPDSGFLRWRELVRNTIFGTTLVRGLPHNPDKERYTVAARITGDGANAVRAIVLMDADMMGEQFFELRRKGLQNLNFDNVTLLLNAVDELAGDRDFIALRKRRPKHRTLETVEARTRVYEEERRKEAAGAEATAAKRLAEAQARLNAAVEAIRRRNDLDEQAKQIMISNVQRSEERRLQVARTNIEDARDRQIENARISMEDSVRHIQNSIKLLAVGLPPIPAFLVLIFVSIRRLRLERMRISSDRRVEGGKA